MPAAADYFTYDGNGGSVTPHRPGVDHLGGASLEDDDVHPPDPETMPHADAWNQMVNLLVGLTKVTGAFVLSIRFSGGDPVVEAFSAVGTSVTSGDLTITDNGDGDTSIEWPAETFPQPVCRPQGLTVNDDVEIDRMRAIPITNGVRVKTKLGATGTDADFSLTVFGQ